VIIPGILVVLISYMSFWITYSAIPGRVSLAVIPVLTSSTLLNITYQNLPNIAYETWLLRFNYSNLAFTVFTMVELGIINMLIRWHANKKDTA
jgi:hypothetical protein